MCLEKPVTIGQRQSQNAKFIQLTAQVRHVRLVSAEVRKFVLSCRISNAVSLLHSAEDHEPRGTVWRTGHVTKIRPICRPRAQHGRAVLQQESANDLALIQLASIKGSGCASISVHLDPPPAKKGQMQPERTDKNGRIR